MIFTLISLFSLLSQSELQNETPFEVRRFQEVIEAHQKNQPDTASEQLITLRARLVLAEKRFQDLETSKNTVTEGRLKRPLEMKALKAEMDHYSKLIASMEASIIQEKRKERTRETKRRK